MLRAVPLAFGVLCFCAGDVAVRSFSPAPAPVLAASPPARWAPHPRLLISPDVLRRLKAKANARDPDWLAVLDEADQTTRQNVADFDRNATPPNTIAYAYQGFGWYQAIVTLGLAWNVTGSTKYAQKIVELLRKVNATAAAGNLDPIATDHGFPSRSAALGVALAFDWTYPALSPADRTATVATLNKWFDWYRAEAFDRDGPAASNYFGGHVLGFGAAGWATAGDNPRAGEIIAHVRAAFEREIAPAFTKGPFAGGYPLEGYVYGTNHYARLVQYMLMAGTAAGTGPDAAVSDYARRMATNLVHALKPNRWQVPDEAVYPGDHTGVLELSLPVLLTGVAPDPARAEVQFLLNHLGTPPRGVTRQPTDVDRLLYWDPARAAIDPAGAEPLVLYSPGDEHLFMRSGWAGGAVWASFNGGLAILSDHQVRAAGHLAIQRGNDYLLVHAGQWKGKDGVTGNPQQFETTSAFANTLFFSDGGAYLYDGPRYQGGQSPFAAARPLRHAQSADLTWAKLDATPIYDRKPDDTGGAGRSLRQFVRNFAYLAPETFVLFDRVRAARPTYVKHLRFQLSGPGEIKQAGNLVTSRLGSSALHVRALLPRAPTMKIDWNVLDGVRLNPRLEVGTRDAGTDLDALTVLSAVDRGAAAPEARLVTAEGGVMLGTHVETAPRASLVLFAAAVSGAIPPATTVRYAVPSRRPCRQVLFDLAPRRTFHVSAQARADGAAGTVLVTVAAEGDGLAIATDEAGILTFGLIDGRPVALR